MSSSAEWNRAGFAALREIAASGLAAWIERETQSPSLPDPDWHRLAVSCLSGIPPPSPPADYSDPSGVLTWKCATCKDTDVVSSASPWNRPGPTFARRCPDCRHRRDIEIGAGAGQRPQFTQTTENTDSEHSPQLSDWRSPRELFDD